MTKHSANRVVVAGGAGYIGAHVAVELAAAGRAVLIVDDFSNASPVAVDRVKEIAGVGAKIECLRLDLADSDGLGRLEAAAHAFGADSAIHLAGLKAVGESVAEPMRYYETNLKATFNLIRVLRNVGARTLAFSSSATVYGEADLSPVPETTRLAPANPYGRTKLFIEEMLRDLAAAEPDWRICSLRYFNPVGAHASGRIGEDPRGTPNNLFPFIAQVAVGRREKLFVYGGDYPTRDGTGVRDYIHVVDLAKGHVAALDHLVGRGAGGSIAVNLGTGRGYSVLEAVAAFERASGRKAPIEIVARRPGDAAEVFADPTLAGTLFGWRALSTLDEMCADHWRWQSGNPHGYETT